MSLSLLFTQVWYKQLSWYLDARGGESAKDTDTTLRSTEEEELSKEVRCLYQDIASNHNPEQRKRPSS